MTTMRLFGIFTLGLVVGCGEPSRPAATATSHIAVPDWVEGRSTSDAKTTSTLDAPKLHDDTFSTKTIGAETSSAPKASGRRIDLDVQDADIHDVCRLLAEVGKANIVVADDVHGRVTIRMKHVPWDEALAAILRAKGFDSMREGDVILVVSGSSK